MTAIDKEFLSEDIAQKLDTLEKVKARAVELQQRRPVLEQAVTEAAEADVSAGAVQVRARAEGTKPSTPKPTEPAARDALDALERELAEVRRAQKDLVSDIAQAAETERGEINARLDKEWQAAQQVLLELADTGKEIAKRMATVKAHRAWLARPARTPHDLRDVTVRADLGPLEALRELALRPERERESEIITQRKKIADRQAIEAEARRIREVRHPDWEDRVFHDSSGMGHCVHLPGIIEELTGKAEPEAGAMRMPTPEGGKPVGLNVAQQRVAQEAMREWQA